MTKTHRPWYTVLYIQVLIAIAAGILIGQFWPDLWDPLESTCRHASLSIL